MQETQETPNASEAVDRISKYMVIGAVANKTVEADSEAPVRRLTALRAKALAITADIGCEFAGQQQIAKAPDAAFYFATPYHSWQRGLNEHTNGLIHQYFPKDRSLAAVTKTEVDGAARLLNSRPRKILGYKTPQQVFSTTPPGALHC
jgi:transposase, IS30 family